MIKATRTHTQQFWQVNRESLKKIFTDEELNKIIIGYSVGEPIGVVVLTESEMKELTELWRQKR